MTTVKDVLNLPSFETAAASKLDVDNMTIVDWTTKSIDGLINQLSVDSWGEIRKSSLAVKTTDGVVSEPCYIFVNTDLLAERPEGLDDEQVDDNAMRAISNVSNPVIRTEVEKFWTNFHNAMLTQEIEPTWEIRIESHTFGSDTEAGKTYFCMTAMYDNPKGECLYVGFAMDLDIMSSPFKERYKKHLEVESSKSSLANVH
jgi:hypothetical protein